MKTKKTLALVLVLALLCAVCMTACSGGSTSAPASSAGGETSAAPTESAASGDDSASSGDTIKIGVLEPMTGANASGGIIEVEGIQMANEDYPEVLGKKIELVIEDNKSDKVESANAASKLVNQDKVCAVIGSWGSSLCLGAGSVFQDAQVPAVAASATNPLVTQGNDYYFRICFIDPYQGTVMAKYAYDQGYRKIAIIKEISNDYSVGLASYFVTAFQELTGDENCIVSETSYNTGDQDFTAQVTEMASKAPDAIFAPGNYTESALIIKQAKAQGIDIPILGGDTWEVPEFIEIGGSDVEGIILSTFFDAQAVFTDKTAAFVEAYKAKYGKDPAGYTALGYDVYCLIVDAIERAGSTDPQAIRDAIATTQDFVGVAGNITLDENGDAVKPVVMKKVENGQFVYHSLVEAE